MFKKILVLSLIISVSSSCVSSKIYKELDGKYTSLKNDYDSLSTQNEAVISERNSLQNQLDQLQKKYDSLTTIEEIKHNHNPHYLFKNKTEFKKKVFKRLKKKKIRQNEKLFFGLDGGVIFLTKVKVLNNYLIGGNLGFVKACSHARQLQLTMQRFITDAQQGAIGHTEAIAIGSDGGTFHIQRNGTRLA